MALNYTTALVLFVLIMALFLATVSEGKRRHHTKGCKPRFGLATIDRPNCRKKSFLSKGCLGWCLSSARPIPNRRGRFAKTCSCCSPVQWEQKNITLHCRGGDITVAIASAIKCMCRPCS